MSIAKDILEIIYYIAFIGLTGLIVWYAKKTYDDQTKQTSNLLLKFTIPADQLGLVEQMVFLELYNHGTRPAKDIAISIGGNEIVHIDYIKPNGTEYLPIGEVLRMIGCNRVFIQNEEIDHCATVCIGIKEDGKASKYVLNTSALFIRSEVLHNESEKLADAVKDINITLGKAFDCHHIGPAHSSFRDELCNIAQNLKQKKD